MNRFSISPSQPSALIPSCSDGATKIMAGIGRYARRRLGRRPRIILSARTAAPRVSVRELLGRARSLRPDVVRAQAALHAGVVRAKQRHADRQLRAATELGRRPQLRHLDIRAVARARLGVRQLMRSMMLTLLLVGCSAVTQQNPETAIRDAEAQLAEAFTRQDVATIDRLWSDDFVFTAPTGKVFTKQQRVVGMKPIPAGTEPTLINRND